MDNKTFIKLIYDKHKMKRFLNLIIGLLLVSLAYNMFNKKCNLVYGVSGVGLMVNKVTGIDPSLTILVCNVFLLGISFLALGKNSTKNTILGALLYPVFIKLTEPFGNIDLGNLEPFLIAACGALVTGLGLGLIFKEGYTTGGSDILNQIISKYAKMSMGKAMYFTDLVIIFFALAVFDFPTFVYSVISMYIIGMITDKVILGISGSKAFYIITEHETEVKRFITENLSHGVTVLEARGGYTGNMEKVIMCIVPTKEYFLFKEGIHMIDKDAFFIVTDAYEVSGGV